jgi:hypothetical protein
MFACHGSCSTQSTVLHFYGQVTLALSGITTTFAGARPAPFYGHVTWALSGIVATFTGPIPFSVTLQGT